MKRKFLACISIVLLICMLCGCGFSLDSSAKKLESKGYTVNKYDAQLIEEMQNQMIYGFGGKGKIINAFSAVKEEENVVVIEFENRSDLEVIYREMNRGVSKPEKIDLNGNILAYGTEKAVKLALK